MKLIYDGPIDEVEVPEADIVAARGEPVEVPDDVAARLLEQDIWTDASAKRGSRKPDETAGGEG